MATLQNIRDKSVLLLAVIGIAMLAFILGDLLKSTNSGGGNSVNVGEILGNDILIQAFQQKVDEGIENWKNQNQQTDLNQTTIAQIRDQVWNQYVRELVMEREFEALGIDVSDEEWIDQISGPNVHPQVRDIPLFKDPKTGVFDGSRAIQYLQAVDQDETGESLAKWVGFQRSLIGLIKNSKYNLLVSNSIFTTTEEAKLESSASMNNVTFNYVALPFTSIDDSDVEPTYAELEMYYSDHKLEYVQDASKDVDFVVFTVVPSLEDDAKTKSEITELAAEFESYDNYELMVRRNSDNPTSRFAFTTLDGLKDPNFEDLFNSKKGTVSNPYLTSPGIYRIAKLVDVEFRPDSLEARHILIKETQTMSLDSVNKVIESLRSAIKIGADFELLAKQNSEDQGSAIKGGDLGWFSEGQMVDEFNEACFSSKKGDISVVETQFGVHLIEVTKTSKLVRKVKIAFIDREVEPSTETFNSYEYQAVQFTDNIINEGLHFDTLISTNNLVKRSDKRVTTNKQNIAGLPNSREMVRWMHSAEVNSVSEIFHFDNSYVVAYITKEYFEGPSELEDIKEQITSLVIKEKKALKILEDIKGSDLTSIAAANSTEVVTGKKATFSNLSIQGVGYEPELVGGIFANKVDVVSSPLKGRNAVYIFQITAIDESNSNDTDLYLQRSQMNKQVVSYANNASYNALKEAANVKDNRVDFY
jgi:peptidyl-prolyl cis-trans isomerase D